MTELKGGGVLESLPPLRHETHENTKFTKADLYKDLFRVFRVFVSFVSYPAIESGKTPKLHGCQLPLDPAVGYEPDERDGGIQPLRDPVVDEGEHDRRCIERNRQLAFQIGADHLGEP